MQKTKLSLSQNKSLNNGCKKRQVLVSFALMVSILAVVLVFLLTSRVRGYELGYHQDMTYSALQGFSDDAKRMISNYNLFVDIRTNTPGFRSAFLRRIHFDDRFKFSEHHDLWKEVEGILRRYAGCKASSKKDLRDFAGAIGTVFHGVQDYYSHSNHTEEIVSALGGSFSPATFNDVLTKPSWDVLRSVWFSDIFADEIESLISGAYFKKPPPDIFDAQGNKTFLTHDILQKDQPIVTGAYLYDSVFNRRTMHHRSKQIAIIDSKRMLDIARKVNPSCYRALQRYKFSFIELLYERFRSAFAVFVGTISGHWRSGDNKVTGDGLLAVIDIPLFTESEEAPAEKLKFSYLIKNLGIDNIVEFSISAIDGLAVLNPIIAPDGWIVSQQDDRIVWMAKQGVSLAQNDTIQFELKSDPKSVLGLLSLTTESGKNVDLVGPTLPTYMDAALVRVIAESDGLNLTETLDSFGIPGERRQDPLIEKRSSQLIFYILILLCMVFAVCIVALWMRLKKKNI